jgi:glycerol-3-phosphate acyltransferase PlsX
MRIAIDAMGGDNAPLEIVKGAYMVYSECDDIELTLIGDEKQILDSFVEIGQPIPQNLKIVHTDVYVTMDDDPMIVMKEKNDSSMAIGLQMLKDGEFDAFLSAGSTGALHIASTLVVRKIKGVRRSAIAAILPFEKPILMLDSGANPEVAEDILNQWAILGSHYAEHMFGIESPRVGLLNIGTEEHKGTHIHQQAYELLKNNNKIQFVGNVESKELVNCPCDVLITDGFAGNITLKLVEGLGMFMFSSLKEMFTKNLITKLSYLSMKKQLKEFKMMFDASEYGGAPLLGLSKPVIKAHGSSKAADIRSAIKQADRYSKLNIIQKISNSLVSE